MQIGVKNITSYGNSNKIYILLVYLHVKMVRVNLIDVKDLTDEHLIAENVELQMLLKFISKHPTGNMPDKFTLNKGHMSFFRDKAGYVTSRLRVVQMEMVDRKINVNMNYYDFIDDKSFTIPLENFNYYTPSKRDMNIIAERIKDRVLNPLKKKTLFKYYGNRIDPHWFVNRYDKYLSEVL